MSIYINEGSLLHKSTHLLNLLRHDKNPALLVNITGSVVTDYRRTAAQLHVTIDDATQERWLNAFVVGTAAKHPDDEYSQDIGSCYALARALRDLADTLQDEADIAVLHRQAETLKRQHVLEVE